MLLDEEETANTGFQDGITHWCSWISRRGAEETGRYYPYNAKPRRGCGKELWPFKPVEEAKPRTEAEGTKPVCLHHGR
jgi:hypothetical protein